MFATLVQHTKEGALFAIELFSPALIGGFSDENYSVQDVAMRSGRVTIRSPYGKAHIDKIVPSLDGGICI